MLFAQFVAERVRHVHDEVAASVKLGLEPDLLSGRIPRSDNYLQLCARLVEGNQLTFEEMIAETKTMLAGVSRPITLDLIPVLR